MHVEVLKIFKVLQNVSKYNPTITLVFHWSGNNESCGYSDTNPQSQLIYITHKIRHIYKLYKTAKL